MAKKRQNNYSQYRSFIWAEVKELGIYKYKSKEFNQVVKDIYNDSDKKTLSKRSTQGMLSSYLEDKKEEFFEGESCEYFNLGRKMDELKGTYKGYKVNVNFDTLLPHKKSFNIDKYNYKSSGFQNIVRVADTQRDANDPTPSKTIGFEIDKVNKKINVSVIAGATDSSSEIIKGKGFQKEKSEKELKEELREAREDLKEDRTDVREIYATMRKMLDVFKDIKDKKIKDVEFVKETSKLWSSMNKRLLKLEARIEYNEEFLKKNKSTKKNKANAKRKTTTKKIRRGR